MPNSLVDAKASAIKAIQALTSSLDGLRRQGIPLDAQREVAMLIISDTLSFGIQPLISRVSQRVQDFDTAADPFQRQQDWLRHKSFEALLHGRVQGVLLMSKNALQSSDREPKERIAQILSNLALCIEELRGASVGDFNFNLALSKHVELWRGVLSIGVRVAPAAAELLEANPTAAQCSLEVIREGINNAVKHGKPRRIDVEVETDFERAVERATALSLRVSNDGTRLARRRKPGFGSALLDQLTSQWQIAEGAGGVELRALVSTRRTEQHNATDNAQRQP